MSKTLSHSSVELFDKCPLAWRLTKIDHVTQAPAAPLIFGDAIHQALAADGLGYLANGSRVNTRELMETFNAALVERLNRDDPTGLITKHEIEHMFDDAAAIFAGYVEHVQPYYFPLAVEQWFGQNPVIPIPDAPGWTFTGIVDARIKRNDGYYILDWKTGKPWPEGAEHGKPQASAYIWADINRWAWEGYKRDAMPNAQSVMFVLLPVVDGVCIPERRATVRDHSQRFAYVEHLRTVAREIDAAKASGDFPAKTGPLCGWCGCLGSCETGQDWLRSKGRTSNVPGVTL